MENATRRARDLLSDTPLVDGHNDLPWALRALAGSFAGNVLDAVDAVDLTTEQPGLDTDIVRLRRGGVGIQFWSVFVPCELAGHPAVTAVFEQVELVYALAARYPEHLRIAVTADQAEAAFADGRIASMLGAEGGHCIAESLGVLRALYRVGVRYMTLTHVDNVPWADSATDEPKSGGLNDFGREVVAEMNRLGMLVDLSHVAATTMRDAIAVSSAPVMFSHSSCCAVTDHVRNVPDDVLSSVAGNGGVSMVTFVPSFVSNAYAGWERGMFDAMRDAGHDPFDYPARARFLAGWSGVADRPQVGVEDVVAHVEHAREVAGIDHIGLGGDYDGVAGGLPDGLRDVSCYPVLLGTLLDRGWSEQDCAKLAGRNALRVLRAAEDVAAPS